MKKTLSLLCIIILSTINLLATDKPAKTKKKTPTKPNKTDIIRQVTPVTRDSLPDDTLNRRVIPPPIPDIKTPQPPKILVYTLTADIYRDTATQSKPTDRFATNSKQLKNPAYKEEIRQRLLTDFTSRLRDSLIYVYPIPPYRIKKKEKKTEEPRDFDMVSADSLFDNQMTNLEASQCNEEEHKRASDLHDSVFIKRLQALPFHIEMPYNKIIRSFIIDYIDRNPSRLVTLRTRAEHFFPLFADIFARFNIPYEIQYLAVIESALNPCAVSRMGACGLWQFMPSTARLHGLEVNSLIDQRLDPVKSTYAACIYLNELHDTFNDWNLAIAAYNCGPGNIRKAIARAGGKRDFWSIYPFLPRETRGYLPIFIAACYALNYADTHGICPPAPNSNIKSDTIQSDKRIHLRQIADVININIDTIRQLNPQYTKDIIPGGKNYALVLPEHKIPDFIYNFDTILTYKADELINNRRKEIEMMQLTSILGGYTVNGITYYKVRKGDNLGYIAKKFHCSVKQLKAWNGLTSDFIKVGKTLRIGKK